MDDLFEYYMETDELHLKYAKGEPAVKDREFHDYNEFVYFMNGELHFISKNIQQRLEPGSLILIPQEHFHQFCVDQPEKYTRCILGFYKTPELESLTCEVMDTIKVITDPDKRIVSAFEQLTEITKSDLPYDEKTMFIRSFLVQLLIRLKHDAYATVTKSIALSPEVSQTLNLIDEKYDEELSVEILAKKLNVSPSTLAHKFSREMNIPLYRYISKKRLSVANNMIRSGIPITTAALSCGFSDYSCFYRLYKKYY